LNAEARSQVHQALLSRCHAIADHWYQAIARTSHVPHSAAEVRQRLIELTEQTIALLFTEPFERGQAQAIGELLAGLHYIEPQVLSQTQDVLAQQLIEGLSADQVVALQPRLAELFSGLVAGFFEQARETILSEQEQTRGALTAALRQAKQVAQRAYEEVEQRVQERTAELRDTNESLQREIAERKRAEEALQEAHDELETRVQERTAELAEVNEALRRERDLAEALAEAAAVVSSTLDPDLVLDRILEQASRVVPNDATNIMLIEDDQVHMARWRGYERFGAEEYVSTLVFHIPEMPGLQQMIRSGEPIVISDTTTHPSWVHVPEMEWLQSYAAAPIALRGQVIGFLNADSTSPGFFTQAHAETLRAFASHAAAAIENSQSYQAATQELAERKRIEEELRESEATMRALLNAPIESAILLDTSGTILAINETAVRGLGKSADGLVGLRAYDLIPPALAKSRKTQVDQVFRSGAPVRFEDQRGGRSFDNSLYPIFDAQGKVARIAVYARDITHRKQAEERLLTYQARLRSLASQLSLTEERERRRIAAALHDRVGQTLAISKMKLGALRQLASSTELAKPLDEIREFIEEIIRDTKSLTFELSSPILYELGLEAAVEWLAEQTQHRQGILSCFEDDEQPRPLDDDVRVLLFQAVRELLVNVAKHAQAQHVKVTMQRDGSNIRVTVEDDGAGFAPPSTGSQWGRIKGFGLFSIRERLDHVGGHLEIKSEPGHGTRIALVAPLKREEAMTIIEERRME